MLHWTCVQFSKAFSTLLNSYTAYQGLHKLLVFPKHVAFVAHRARKRCAAVNTITQQLEQFKNNKITQPWNQSAAGASRRHDKIQAQGTTAEQSNLNKACNAVVFSTAKALIEEGAVSKAC